MDNIATIVCNVDMHTCVHACCMCMHISVYACIRMHMCIIMASASVCM